MSRFRPSPATSTPAVLQARRAYLGVAPPAERHDGGRRRAGGFRCRGPGPLRGFCPGCLRRTVCLYAGGVVLNDVFDLEVDRVERPERPAAQRPGVRRARRDRSARRRPYVGSDVRCCREPVAGIVARRDGRRACCSTMLGQTPDLVRPRQHGTVPRRQPDARVSRRGPGAPAGPGHWPHCRLRLHHGGDRRQPRGGPRRKTAGCQLRSDILVVRFTGAFLAELVAPRVLAGRPRPDRSCSVSGCCRPICAVWRRPRRLIHPAGRPDGRVVAGAARCGARRRVRRRAL